MTTECGVKFFTDTEPELAAVMKRQVELSNASRMGSWENAYWMSAQLNIASGNFNSQNGQTYIRYRWIYLLTTIVCILVPNPNEEETSAAATGEGASTGKSFLSLTCQLTLIEL